MKKIIIIFITTLFIGCDTAPLGVQVTFDDEKSNLIRAHFQNYLNNDMDGLKSLWSSQLQMSLCQMKFQLNQYYFLFDSMAKQLIMSPKQNLLLDDPIDWDIF